MQLLARFRRADKLLACKELRDSLHPGAQVESLQHSHRVVLVVELDFHEPAGRMGRQRCGSERAKEGSWLKP